MTAAATHVVSGIHCAGRVNRSALGFSYCAVRGGCSPRLRTCYVTLARRDAVIAGASCG
jgi:hypothetical protein